MAVPIADEVVTAFNELKFSKTGRFVVFRVADNLRSIVVDRVAPRSAQYADLVAALPKDSCRYAVYDLEYATGDGSRSKLVFVLWAPEAASIKMKVIYTTTDRAMRSALVGLSTVVQAGDMATLDYDEVLQKASRGN
eukprot:m51a1_g14608 putative promotes actin filament depolarization in a ph-dependent manner (137) ;mRNA; r:1200575-1200985